jgi:hypothetical protein
MSTYKMSRPQNKRECDLMAAGRYQGMRNYAMALAAQSKGVTRAAHVAAARRFHWTFMARLREAGGAPGYYVSPDMVRTEIECGNQLRSVA